MDTYIPEGFSLPEKATIDLRAMTLATRIQVLKDAYERALEDKKARIPTYLHSAIEAFRA